jgi:hypothetical protein
VVVAGRRARNGGTAEDVIARFDRKPSADCYYAQESPRSIFGMQLPLAQGVRFDIEE